MKVSILILNWNTKDWLLKLVNSLRQHKIETDHELIIVDQGSSDGSVELIKLIERQHHKDVIPIFNHKNVGACNGRNQGVEVASGDFVLFCDSDIEFCEDNWLDKMINTYEYNPDCGIVGPYTNFANGHQNRPRGSFYETKRLNGPHQLISFCMLTPIEIADAFLWNPVLPMFTEADWVRRVISEGWMSYIAPTYVINHGNKLISANKVEYHKTIARAHMIFRDLWKDRSPHLNWCGSVAIWLDTGLGNTVLTLPFLQALRTYSPHLKIDIHAPRGSKFLKLYPHLYDDLHVDKVNEYDICFKMFATSSPQCKAKWTLECNPLKWVQTEIEETMNLLRKAGYNGGTPKIPKPTLSPTRFINKAVIFHTGSYNDPAKEWPFDNFLKVAKHFKEKGYDVVLLGGPEETHKGSDFLKLCGEGDAYDSTGESIKATLQHLDGGDLLVTNDSGVMHLGSVVEIPTLAIFGYTNPIKNPPVNGEIVQSKRDCVPCYGLDGPCEARECILEDITVDMVIRRAESLLCRKRSGNTKRLIPTV